MKKSILLPVLAALLCLITAGCSNQTVTPECSEQVITAGWEQLDNKLCYRLPDGTVHTGFLDLDSSRYFFLSDGTMATGWQEIDGLTYYFNSDGTMATGWLELDGSRYYLNQSGTPFTGWLDLDGRQYHFQKDGRASTGLVQLDGETYLFTEEGSLAEGWFSFAEQTYFANSNGNPTTGWLELDGLSYYFDDYGIMVTGWQEISDLPYYFRPDGTMATGRVTIDGTTHYFAGNGQELLLVNPWNKIPANYEPELIIMNNGHFIAAEAHDALQAMFADCKAAGFSPVICSAYRSMEEQTILFNRKVKFYLAQNYTQQEAETKAATSVAVPGTSEHQLGLALDIVDQNYWVLDETQAEMPTQKWLMENSWRYGFILRYPVGTTELTGIIYEPWHYRYVGLEIAADIYASGLCLEAYLDALTLASG